MIQWIHRIQGYLRAGRAFPSGERGIRRRKWAHLDSNQGPRDYEYFRRLFRHFSMMCNRPSTEGNSPSGDFMPFHVFAHKTPLGVGIGCRHTLISQERNFDPFRTQRTPALSACLMRRVSLLIRLASEPSQGFLCTPRVQR